MAKAVGLGVVATVQRIWAAHGLTSLACFKLSKDPAFVDKPHDIVGHYVSPPTHAVVLPVDEKSQTQALIPAGEKADSRRGFPTRALI